MDRFPTQTTNDAGSVVAVRGRQKLQAPVVWGVNVSRSVPSGQMAVATGRLERVDRPGPGKLAGATLCEAR